MSLKKRELEHTIRFHVKVDGNRRTTVSLDCVIAEALAMQLGVRPDAEDAHGKVRQWLQGAMDRRHRELQSMNELAKKTRGMELGLSTRDASFFCRSIALEAVMKPDILKRLEEWRMDK